jgi:hypothetical protein
MEHPRESSQGAPAPLLELTDCLFEVALERARRAVCGPFKERCCAFSYGADVARQRCTPNGRGTIGWLSRDNGRQAWEAWLDLRTGEGRLRVLPERRTPSAVCCRHAPAVGAGRCIMEARHAAARCPLSPGAGRRRRARCARFTDGGKEAQAQTEAETVRHTTRQLRTQ